jgi:hypothetical protein
MAVPAKQRRKVVLKGLTTAVEWQCAHVIVEHAEPGKVVTLTFGTPAGDLTLQVQPVGQEKLVISKTKRQPT